MKKVLSIAFILAILVCMLPVSVALAGDTMVLPLMAGQFTQVGTVTISDDGVNMNVTYDITVDGWFLTTTHLYVGTAKPKSSAPGLFPYMHEGIYAKTDTFVVPIVDGKTYYVAAHADVVDENTIVAWDCPTVEELGAMLPDSGTIRAINYPNVDSYFDISLDSSTLDGTFPTWCIDETHLIYLGTSYTANLYSSFEPLPDYLTTGTDPNIDHPENLDLVNWVVNHNDGYTAAETQNVIWHLIDANPATALTTHEQVLYNDAFLYGEGFLPDFLNGDVFTMIFAPVTAAGYQTTIAQVTLGELGVSCTPIYGTETAWAQGTLFWKTGWGSYFVYVP